MSFWPIVLIVLAVAMAIGPIMLMQPSSRDKRLADLRQKAALAGLSIRMSDYGQGDQKTAVAVYSSHTNLPKNIPSWSLLRRPYKHEIHFYGVWEWQSDNRVSDNNSAKLRSFLDKLSDDIVGVSVSEKNVSIWWQEKSSKITVGDIKTFLDELAIIAA